MTPSYPRDTPIKSPSSVASIFPYISRHFLYTHYHLLLVVWNMFGISLNFFYDFHQPWGILGHPFGASLTSPKKPYIKVTSKAWEPGDRGAAPVMGGHGGHGGHGTGNGNGRVGDLDRAKKPCQKTVPIGG